jgi:hypothetical protein
VLALALAATLTACSTVNPSATSSTAPTAPSSNTPATTSASGPASVSPSPSATQSSTAPAASELPRGGRELFPTYRLFGYSGYPGAPGQGRLGIGSLDARMNEIEQRGKAWTGGRRLLPVMELIAVTVHGSPGKDGMYRSRAPEAVIKRWHDAAVKHKALLLLNIQPGRADFIDEVKYFEKWLKYPDVGVALDPEWAVEKGQIPGRSFGRTTGAELDQVARYLSQVVEKNNLPEKVMLFHQLHVTIVKQPKQLKKHPGVVYINSVDGIGSPAQKIATYKGVMRTRPSYVHAGFKIFFKEDVATGKRLITAKDVLSLKPQPEYILFE